MRLCGYNSLSVTEEKPFNILFFSPGMASQIGFNNQQVILFMNTLSFHQSRVGPDRLSALKVQIGEFRTSSLARPKMGSWGKSLRM